MHGPGRLEHHVAGRLEQLPASLPHYVIAVDQQDGFGAGHRGARSSAVALAAKGCGGGRGCAENFPVSAPRPPPSGPRSPLRTRRPRAALRPRARRAPARDPRATTPSPPAQARSAAGRPAARAIALGAGDARPAPRLPARARRSSRPARAAPPTRRACARGTARPPQRTATDRTAALPSPAAPPPRRTASRTSAPARPARSRLRRGRHRRDSRAGRRGARPRRRDRPGAERAPAWFLRPSPRRARGRRAPEPVQHARAEALDQHVGSRAQPAQEGRPLARLQIDGDAALAPVQRLELGGQAPERVALAGVLHLDDVGSEIGEEQRRVRPRVQARQIDDANACERAGHAALFASRERYPITFCSFMARPMSPLIFSFPLMNAICGFILPLTMFMKSEVAAVTVHLAAPVEPAVTAPGSLVRSTVQTPPLSPVMLNS